MKKIMLIILASFLLFSCAKIEPGYAGIKVHKYGDQKGVEDFPIVVGKVWYNPITHDIYKFPTFMQNVSWTEDKYEGSEINQMFTFNSVEGVVLEADVGFAYHFEWDLVPSIFIEFRKTADEITDTYVRTKVREAISNIGGTMEVINIMGAGKQRFASDIITRLKDEIEQKGIVVDMFSFIGNIRSDDKRVAESINRVLTQKQRALEAESKIREITAVAHQKVEQARGDSLSLIIQSQGEAKSILNIQRALSSSPRYIDYLATKRWNGILPQVTGGAIPMINLKQ